MTMHSSAIVGPKGLEWARSACTQPKAARASVARPLYLKLLTRQTIKPGIRQTNMPHIRTDQIPTRQAKSTAHKMASEPTVDLSLIHI